MRFRPGDVPGQGAVVDDQGAQDIVLGGVQQPIPVEPGQVDSASDG